MNILHISAAAQNSGAGYAVMLTHQALSSYGINSKVLYLIDESNSNEKIFYYTSKSIIKKLRRLIVTTLDRIPTWVYFKKKEQLFSPGFFGLNLRHTKLLKWANIIHIHWGNHGFVDLKEISKWNKPVVWTLRDMWSFTGGCHYSFDCDKYKSTCGCCPVLGSNSKQDLSFIGLQKKIKYLSASSIHWV
ncbi:MAG: glucosyltransferase, partial [Deltaproteobacteria bacterium]